MKFNILLLLLVFSLPSFAQWKDDVDSVFINVSPPDSIFYLNDIGEYAEKNELIFFATRGSGYEEGLDYYVLGNYSRYSFAEVLENIHLAVKEKNRYKIILLPNASIPQVSEVSVVGTFKFGDAEILELEGYYTTAWSMMSPVAGSYFECNRSVIYINIDNGEILFSKIFKSHYEDTHQYDKYNIDSLYQGLYSEDIFENDTMPKISTFSWFNYYYVVKDKTIEFYKIDKNPTSECSSYIGGQQKEIIATYVSGKKPTFYYKYNEKKKKWIKNS